MEGGQVGPPQRTSRRGGRTLLTAPAETNLHRLLISDAEREKEGELFSALFFGPAASCTRPVSKPPQERRRGRVGCPGKFAKVVLGAEISQVNC
jgi:hypothetical protein